MKIYFQGVIHR